MVGEKRKVLKGTKASEAVQKGLIEYQGYFQKAKNGKKPPVIRVTAQQLEKLGVDSGYWFNGSVLELAQ